MVATNRSNQNVDGILENESTDELCHHLNGRINMQTVVCADAILAHEKLARTLGFTFKELVSFHLQHVNSYHSHLKQYITQIPLHLLTAYLERLSQRLLVDQNQAIQRLYLDRSKRYNARIREHNTHWFCIRSQQTHSAQ